ncbi:MAG: hypothetical protein LBV15_01510 [Planctomycetota bacterium]|nr:hypothetical protein [Planctomycetota bacterium]
MRGSSDIVFRFPAWKAFLALLASVFFALPAFSLDADGAYALSLSRCEELNSQLESLLKDMDNPTPAAGYPRRLLSLSRNAQVTVGGELRVNYATTFGNSAGANPSGDPVVPALSGRTRLADLTVSAARLNLSVQAGRRWRAYFSLNLQGYNGLSPTADTVNLTNVYARREKDGWLGQAYVELIKSGHSGLGFKIGLQELPFGLRTERQGLFARSFLDAGDLAASHLLEPFNREGGLRLPHASRFLDPAAAALLTYEMRDIVRFEAGLFQEIGGSWHGGERRQVPDNPYWLGSWQAGASFLPLEGWELSVFFRNRHDRNRGIRYWTDSPFRWDFRHNLASGGVDPVWNGGQWRDAGTGPAFGSRRNEQALSVGLAAEIPGTPLAVRLEYAHGWNQGFNQFIHSDEVNLGLSYRLTPFLTLFGQAEWLRQKDRSWMTPYGRDIRRNRLNRFLLGAEYEFSRGLTLEAGWQYEYWRLNSELGGPGGRREQLLNRASVFYLGSRFRF